MRCPANAAGKRDSVSSSEEESPLPLPPQRNDPYRTSLARGNSVELDSSSEDEEVKGATGLRDPDPHEIGKAFIQLTARV